MSFYSVTYPTYPVGLPNASMGSTLTIETSSVQNSATAGYPYLKTRFANYGFHGNLKFQFTNDQMKTFLEFWNNTLRNGRIAFTSNKIYLLGVAGLYYIAPLGVLRKAKVAPNTWSVSFQVYGWNFPTLSEQDVLNRFISASTLERQTAQIHSYLKSYYDLGDQPSGNIT
ncbi:UNVERIFIED_ORG: hypothetical protein GCAPEGMB_00438 [Vibrio phage V07]